MENKFSAIKPSLAQSESILHNSRSQLNIRDHLKIWQEQLTKGMGQEDFNPLRLNSNEEAFQHDFGSSTFSPDEAFALPDDPVFLRPGDVVDLSWVCPLGCLINNNTLKFPQGIMMSKYSLFLSEVLQTNYNSTLCTVDGFTDTRRTQYLLLNR